MTQQRLGHPVCAQKENQASSASSAVRDSPADETCAIYVPFSYVSSRLDLRNENERLCNIHPPQPGRHTAIGGGIRREGVCAKRGSETLQNVSIHIGGSSHGFSR